MRATACCFLRKGTNCFYTGIRAKTLYPSDPGKLAGLAVIGREFPGLF